MSDANKQLILRWFEEVWNQGRRETIEKLLSADCILHDGDQITQGPSAFLAFYDRIRSAFDEIQTTPEHLIAEGDYVCLRWSSTMRHSGDGLGVPASGKTVSSTGITIIRCQDGRFAEGWQNWDMLGMLQQVTGSNRAATYVA